MASSVSARTSGAPSSTAGRGRRGGDRRSGGTEPAYCSTTPSVKSTWPRAGSDGDLESTLRWPGQVRVRARSPERKASSAAAAIRSAAFARISRELARTVRGQARMRPHGPTARGRPRPPGPTRRRGRRRVRTRWRRPGGQARDGGRGQQVEQRMVRLPLLGAESQAGARRSSGAGAGSGDPGRRPQRRGRWGPRPVPMPAVVGGTGLVQGEQQYGAARRLVTASRVRGRSKTSWEPVAHRQWIG